MTLLSRDRAGWAVALLVPYIAFVVVPFAMLMAEVMA